MELEIVRTYFPKGTNGQLSCRGEWICSTIELPDKKNAPRVSCIPEGTYELMMRYSQHFDWHLELLKVPGRELILIHPANIAMKELKGCIAPVSSLTGPGLGSRSRLALERLIDLVFPVLRKKEKVFLTIKS